MAKLISRRPTSSPSAQLAFYRDAHKESQANRGKTLEQMLERRHNAYHADRIGKIERIENAWRYGNPGAASNPALWARTGTGSFIVRAQTPWDYHGHYRGMPLALDAKEFAEASIRIEHLTRHQAAALADFERSGGVAGFLIYSRRTTELFWLDGIPAFRLVEDLRLRRDGHKKSLNIECLRASTLALGEALPWQAPDYAEILFRRFTEGTPAQGVGNN